MSDKVHIFASKEPVLQWPEELEALCHARVIKPKPIFDFRGGHYESASTIYFCEKCVNAVPQTRIEEAQWFYGVAPQQTAEDMNRNSDSTGEY